MLFTRSSNPTILPIFRCGGYMDDGRRVHDLARRHLLALVMEKISVQRRRIRR